LIEGAKGDGNLKLAYVSESFDPDTGKDFMVIIYHLEQNNAA
jgi:hypothetical protein